MLLLDCQGLNDDQDMNSRNADAIISLFALKISKIHIINVKDNLRTDDFYNLDVSAERFFVAVIGSRDRAALPTNVYWSCLMQSKHGTHY